MLKKMSALLLVFILMLEGSALALEGEVIFRNSLYGAAVGGLIGLGLYAMDQNDSGSKIGGGIVLGTLVGAVVGVAETTHVVEYRNGKMFVNTPTPVVMKRGDETEVRIGLLSAAF